MKSIHPKFSNIILTLLVVGIMGAVAVYASYTEPDPTKAFPGNNSEPYLDESIHPDVKTGGLSVNSFISRSNAQFDQDTTFKDVVKPIGGTTILKVGTGVLVNGQIHAAAHLNSQTIAHASNPTPQSLCADTNGNIVFCAQGVPPSSPYTFLGSTNTATTSALACSSLIGSSQPYYQANTAPPFPAPGIVIYSDYNLTVPYSGNSKWYNLLVNVQNGGGTNYAVQISPTGVNLATNVCP